MLHDIRITPATKLALTGATSCGCPAGTAHANWCPVMNGESLIRAADDIVESGLVEDMMVSAIVSKQNLPTLLIRFQLLAVLSIPFRRIKYVSCQVFRSAQCCRFCHKLYIRIEHLCRSAEFLVQSGDIQDFKGPIVSVTCKNHANRHSNVDLTSEIEGSSLRTRARTHESFHL